MAGQLANPLAGAVAAALGNDSELTPPPAPAPPRERVQLWEMDQSLICPVIGTCLTIEDLVQALRKAGVQWEQQPPSDFEIHHLVVHRMDSPCRLARIISKMLDKRYQRFVRGIGQEQRKPLLRQAWDQAIAAGEVPGTLWALVTNRACGEGLLQHLYRDVHMLSHLNGGSHRKDLGRLRALEQELRGLSEALHRKEVRYRQKLDQRDCCVRELERELTTLRGRRSRTPDPQGLQLQLSETSTPAPNYRYLQSPPAGPGQGAVRRQGLPPLSSAATPSWASRWSAICGVALS